MIWLPSGSVANALNVSSLPSAIVLLAMGSRFGARFAATVIVNVSLSASGGRPSSVTSTRTVNVPVWAAVGVQRKYARQRIDGRSWRGLLRIERECQVVAVGVRRGGGKTQLGTCRHVHIADRSQIGRPILSRLFDRKSANVNTVPVAAALTSPGDQCSVGTLC